MHFEQWLKLCNREHRSEREKEKERKRSGKYNRDTHIKSSVKTVIFNVSENVQTAYNVVLPSNGGFKL